MKSFNTVAVLMTAGVLSGCLPGPGPNTTLPGADTVLSCDASSQSCATQHAVKADACLKLAQVELKNGRASGAVASQRAICARDNFAIALGTLADANGTYGAGNLASLRVLREVAKTTAEGRSANDAMDQAAAVYASAHPGLNAGPYYQGDAALYRALRAASPDCARLGTASQLAVAAAAGSNAPKTPSLASAIATLNAQSAQAASQSGCTS